MGWNTAFKVDSVGALVTLSEAISSLGCRRNSSKLLTSPLKCIMSLFETQSRSGAKISANPGLNVVQGGISAMQCHFLCHSQVIRWHRCWILAGNSVISLIPSWYQLSVRKRIVQRRKFNIDYLIWNIIANTQNMWTKPYTFHNIQLISQLI